MDIQREVIQFLLKRLKACAIETIAYHGVLMNLSEGDQSRAKRMLGEYRDSKPVRQRVEKEFQALDELVQRVLEQPNQEEARRLLEQFDLTGRLVN